MRLRLSLLLAVFILAACGQSESAFAGRSLVSMAPPHIVFLATNVCSVSTFRNSTCRHAKEKGLPFAE
jgi:hypothetical protein